VDNEKITIIGEIKDFIYESNDSLYKVIKIVLEDSSEITITGSFSHLNLGLSYKFLGYYKETKYGMQFQVESYTKCDNYTKDGLISYLSSDRFYGIGEKIANEIVENLGVDAIKKIIDNPDVLNDIKSLNKTKRQILIESLKKNYQEEDTFIKLYEFGLTPKMVEKLYNSYGLSAPDIILENPYRLIDEIEGYGFKKCDSLALSLGFPIDSNLRIKSAILYAINNICYNYGFTYLTLNQLLKSTFELLNNVNENLINNSIDELIEEKKLIYEDDRIYHYELYNSEVKIKEKLFKINESNLKLFKREDILKALDEVESDLNIKYTYHQKDAIVNSLENKLSIITGGPGTGKSTIIKGIVYTYAKLNNYGVYDEIMNYKVLLCAPTGRAAKRMNEATSFKALTIHKALGYNSDGFSFNEYKLLSQSLIIIDEMSMVDINLCKHLLLSLSSNCQIILVGDQNQLPAVGPGNVLSDLINTYIFKTTKLNQILRQKENSDIIKLSNQVLTKRLDYSIFGKRNEVFFYKSEGNELFDVISKILDNFILKGGNLLTGIQILIPMYNGINGINEINRLIQEKYNKSEKSIIRDNRLFKQNDKVLQIKNDSELDLMNGDIGRIVDIIKEDEKDVMYIDFYDRLVKYPISQIDNLVLGYAISIHKSQGSEFLNVIMPILPSYNIMLKPKIIYTGITRAKEKLILIGNINSLDYAIKQQDLVRQTSLSYRININKDIKIDKINDPEIPFDTFGEYDMEGITPYTFM